ncbi:uncharacterized protein LOC116057793 [Sander lucioperca]|uniref:uncharacterized protein LOC116057793 n=1 Tax=Sander lucioperca TaxID=283035 RepID=UPI00125E321C|nr:uncharacterized protein LOC116057793 [Sander lucioperca]
MNMDSIYSDHTYSHCFNHRALPTDVQKVIVGEEHQQEWSSSLDQEDKMPPHIKEEQVELRISQDGEQLQGLEEADITKFPFTLLHVKSEDNKEKPQFLQLCQRQTQHMETEADGEDCGGPETTRNTYQDTRLQPDTDAKTGDASESETDDSEDWKETREPQSGVPVSDSRCSAAFRLWAKGTGETLVSLSPLSESKEQHIYYIAQEGVQLKESSQLKHGLLKVPRHRNSSLAHGLSACLE